jgi:hypothetical protein
MEYTNMTLPNAPQGLAATVFGATVALSWTAKPQSDGVIEYLVFRTPAVYFMPELIAATAGTAYTDSSGELLPNTQWYYFVVAVNMAGTSPAAATTSVAIPLPLPSAPTGLVATANGNDTVSLSWNANPASQDVTGYNVYREASGSSSATLLTTVAGTSYTDTDSALTAGSSWTYYLETVNATGTSPASASASVTIPQSAGGGTLIATVAVNNYGTAAVANPQMSFAQPFAPGDVPSGNFIQLRKSDGVTVIPSQQDQESTWLQDNSWKAVALSSVSPDTFAAGETITYQLWSVPGSPKRIPNVTLAQLVANSDIKLLFTGYDLGTDTWEVSVNDIVANGTNWPWGQNPTRGWEVIRSGPLCTEWRFWSVLRRVSDGAWHPWIRGVVFVRAWGAAGPYEIGGYWCMPNIFGPNPGSASGGGTISTSSANDFIFAAYRMSSIQSPTAGDTWTQISGADYLLTEYEIVSSAQSRLISPIGTGNGNQTQGIGDAIPNGVLDANANAHVHATNGGASGSSLSLPGLSTNGTNRVIVVAFLANSAPGLSVASASGLSFTRRAQESETVSGTSIYLETWYAVAASQLTNEIITINTNGTATYITADAFAVSGANTSAPFDANSALPANLVGAGSGPETHYCFTATVQDGNTVLMYYGGPNDYRTAATSSANAVPLNSSTVSGNQINLTQAQHVALCGANSWVCNSPAGANFAANNDGSAALPVVLSVAGGSLPGGLNAGQVYWMGTNGGNFSVYFCATLGNASNGGSGAAIALSGTGSGNLTITPVSQCYPVMAQAVLDQDCRRIWRNGTKPTLLVEHDFTYLTTKARVIPPFIPGITVDSGAAPSVTPQFSQCALYYPGQLGGTGDGFNDDRIGWLTHHQACELYRPFDNSLHQLNLAIAASWIEYGYWALNETVAAYPVVNVTNYPNMGTPVGPNSRLGYGQGAITVQIADGYIGDISGSHQPCPMILPYLKSGDFLWYEAMAAFSSTRMLTGYNQTVTVGSVTAYKPWSYISGPISTLNNQGSAGFYYNGNEPDDGIQVRGLGWIMRYFGTTVHFMPQSRPEAQYFRDQLHGCIAIMDENTTLNYTTGALGFLEASNESSNPYLPYVISTFFHDYCYLCWAMEAWKGEYSEALHFIANFFYRYCPKRSDTSDPNNPGSIWELDVYQHANGDLSGNWIQTWDEAGAAMAQYTSATVACDAMVSFARGSSQLTVVYATNLYNLEPGQSTCNTTFGDFPGWPMVKSVSGSTVTLEGLYGAGSPPAASMTRSIITVTTAGGSGTSLNFASVPSGVVIGMGVYDVTNPNAIPIGTAGTGDHPRSTFVTAVGATSVTLDTPIGAQGGPTSIPSGDTIAFGAIARFGNSVAEPWPGIATVNSTFPFTDTICPISNSAEYTAPFSYVCTYTCALAMADVLYQQTGNANLASARTAYNEIRRRQYLTVLSDGKTPSPFGSLSFANAPKYAIGPIGATQ